MGSSASTTSESAPSTTSSNDTTVSATPTESTRMMDALVQSDDDTKVKKRKISYHNVKAHSNPLSDKQFPYPISPSAIDWSKHYPKYPNSCAEFADVGCGFGGLLVGLSTLFPSNFTLGLEIRDKVVESVEDRIQKLRTDYPSQYENISVIRANAMKYFPNYFRKGQLSKIFFLFPDPHFKKSNHRRRIISPQLLAEYAYALKIGGIAYTATDVEDLHKWMAQHFEMHPLFERISEEQLKEDPVVPVILNDTEEAKKVQRQNGKKFLAVFRRVEKK